MKQTPITADHLGASVIAVPPLARSKHGSVSANENASLIHHIEKGGVRTILYGGNANFYHIRPSEYRSTLEMVAESAGAETYIIPAVGPQFGTALDQAEAVRDIGFPTSMLLPTLAVKSEQGLADGFRRYTDAVGHPAVLYLKDLGYLRADTVATLVDQGHVSWIKYAVVLDDPADDPYLTELVSVVDPSLIVSGIGEQPAIAHLTGFGLNGFTTGCGCIAPRLSQEMLRAIKADDINRAEVIREMFAPLEALRNQINPIRVLHEAVGFAGIAETGDHLPYLSPVPADRTEELMGTASALLFTDQT